MAQSEAVEALHDKDTERAVLGALLLDTAVIPKVTAILGDTPNAFFTTDHQIIYTAVLEIYERHNKADIILVADRLKATDQLKRVGGTIYLHDLHARIVETANTEFHAQILRDKWIRREMVAAGGAMREIAHDGETDIIDALDNAQELLMRLAKRNTNLGFVLLNSLVSPVLEEIESIFHQQNEYAGLATGYTDFDIMTSGLQRGDLIILAARPSMGKTSLALNIAANVALDQQKPVAIFSLEMPARQVTMRMLAAEARLDFARIRVGNIPDDHWATLTNAATHLMEIGKLVSIHEARGITMSTVRAEARRLKAEQPGLALIIVDYLQLLRGSGQYAVREQEISDISRSLKELAWELDLPILACSQLNREVERRPDKKPQLSDLRESGAIEQDADVVAFLHRDEQYDPNSDEQGLADLIIRKQRNGQTGSIKLQFIKEQMRFANITV